MASWNLQMTSCEGQMASCEGHPDASKMIWQYQYHGSNTIQDGHDSILPGEWRNESKSIDFFEISYCVWSTSHICFQVENPPQCILCECKLNLDSSNCLLFQSSHTTMDKLPMCICICCFVSRCLASLMFLEEQKLQEQRQQEQRRQQESLGFASDSVVDSKTWMSRKLENGL